MSIKQIDISKTVFQYFKNNFLEINELHLKEFYEASVFFRDQ